MPTEVVPMDIDFVWNKDVQKNKIVSVKLHSFPIPLTISCKLPNHCVHLKATCLKILKQLRVFGSLQGAQISIQF